MSDVPAAPSARVGAERSRALVEPRPSGPHRDPDGLPGQRRRPADRAGSRPRSPPTRRRRPSPPAAPRRGPPWRRVPSASSLAPRVGGTVSTSDSAAHRMSRWGQCTESEHSRSGWSRAHPAGWSPSPAAPSRRATAARSGLPIPRSGGSRRRCAPRAVPRPGRARRAPPPAGRPWPAGRRRPRRPRRHAPHSGSGRPTTHAARTPGCAVSTRSTAAGRDLLPAGDDHVVDAAEHLEPAVPPAAEVAGAERAAVVVLDERGRGRDRVVEVAGRQRRAAEHDATVGVESTVPRRAAARRRRSRPPSRSCRRS